LWHWRLVYISIERIKKLVNEWVLSISDFTDFDTCVDYIKGKLTNRSKFGANTCYPYMGQVVWDTFTLCLDKEFYFLFG